MRFTLWRLGASILLLLSTACGAAETPGPLPAACSLPATSPGPERFLFISTDLSACGSGVHENDDAFAMAWALRKPNVTVVGIGVAHGNVGANADVTDCAHRLVELSGKNVPVFAGAPSAASLGVTSPSSQAMSDLSRRYKGKLWISTQGTTTDLATAFIHDPGIASRLGGVLVMAGVLDGVAGRMNFDPVNSYGDMTALDLVLRSYANIVVTPLDLNEDTVLTRAEWDAIGATGDPLLAYIHEQSREWMDLMAPFIGGFYNFDSLGYAPFFHPDLLTRREFTRLRAKFGSIGWIERTHETGVPVSDVWLDVDLAKYRVAYLRGLGVDEPTIERLYCANAPGAVREPLAGDGLQPPK